jgi:hypothetical protein
VKKLHSFREKLLGPSVRSAVGQLLGKLDSIYPGLWIRIGSGVNDFVDPDSESGSKGKKMSKEK